MHASAKSPVLWIARGLWLAVAVVGGSGFGDAFAPHSRAVQLTGTVGLWVAWAGVAVVLLLPSALGLTITRMVVPMGLVAAVVATVDAGITAGTVLAIATTALATLVVASGEYGQAMVQASAYGDEWRFVLRPPAAFLLPSVVSWATLCAAAIAGPLSLAARSWVLGVVVTVVAVVLGRLLLARFHRLSRRWIVLVPAGFVLHDHVVLAETVMLRSAQITGAGLALEGTGAADLTGPAGGHAVEVSLSEAATVVLAGTRQKPGGTALHVYAFLCAPSRPGKLLRAAGDHGLPVG